MGGGKGGGTCTVAGYWYKAGIHMVFCQSVDELHAILVNKKPIWKAGNTYITEEWVWNGTEWVKEIVVRSGTSITTNTHLYINQKELFGGQDGSGGIEGYVDIEFGGATQGKNPYLVRVIGNDISAHRGVFGFVLNHMTLTCNTPQIYPWEIRAKRTKMGWNDALCEIDGDMNPSHILYECLTNTSWGGLGYPPEAIDEDSFFFSSITLENEGYGISMLWNKDCSLDDFMKTVLAHINGVLFQSYKTGLFTLKLIRDDYAGLSIPILNESNIISLENYETKATSETINHVTVKFTNRENDSADSVTVSDSANIAAVGRVINATKEYFGFTKASVASKAASRELLQLSVPISKITIIVNRTQYGLEPGDVFIFEWDKLGISNHIMRVTSVDIGTLDNSVIRIDAVTDIFGFEQTVISDPDDTMWQDPSQDPQPLSIYRVEEVTYYQAIYEIFKSDEPTVTDTIHDTDTYFHGIADAPSYTYTDYELWDKIGTGNFNRRAVGQFSPLYTIQNEIKPEVYSWLELDKILSEGLSVGEYYGRYGYLGDELVQIVGINQNKDQIQVARGIHDTVPTNHSIGTTFQLCDGMYSAKDRVTYAVSDVVDFKFLPATGNGRISELQVPDVVTKTAEARMNKPYPPGNVKINDEAYPEATSGYDPSLPENTTLGSFTVTWSHRDRLTQTNDIFHQDYGDIGPEANVLYNLRVYDPDGILLLDEVDINGTIYKAVLNDPYSKVRIELESTRDSKISHQTHNITVEFAGYGFNYGKFYGGVS